MSATREQLEQLAATLERGCVVHENRAQQAFDAATTAYERGIVRGYRCGAQALRKLLTPEDLTPHHGTASGEGGDLDPVGSET